MLVAAVATTAGCDKNAVQQIAEPVTGGVAIKFFNFSVGAPQVNFYVNDGKVTAVSSTGCAILDDTNRQQCLSTGKEATTGVGYGSAGNGANGWYSAIEPGQITLAGKIASAVDSLNHVPISNLQTTVQDGKFYSYYLSGVYDAATKTSDSFIVEDVIPTATDFTNAYIRFVNASSTATGPMTLWLKERTTKDSLAIGSSVSYKSASAFVPVPVWRTFTDSLGVHVAQTSWDLVTRYDGSATAVFSRSQLSFSGNRAYTITARGNVNTASTMALDNTANR